MLYFPLESLFCNERTPLELRRRRLLSSITLVHNEEESISKINWLKHFWNSHSERPFPGSCLRASKAINFASLCSLQSAPCISLGEERSDRKGPRGGPCSAPWGGWWLHRTFTSRAFIEWYSYDLCILILFFNCLKRENRVQPDLQAVTTESWWAWQGAMLRHICFRDLKMHNRNPRSALQDNEIQYL